MYLICRGKLLNVRDATALQISDNAEIQHIKQILGLQHGKAYEDVKALRYGHLMIMTDQVYIAGFRIARCTALLLAVAVSFIHGPVGDGRLLLLQDHDGSHIKGLIMNFMHTFYPSLLKIPGFLVEFITPIIKVPLLYCCTQHSFCSAEAVPTCTAAETAAHSDSIAASCKHQSEHSAAAMCLTVYGGAARPACCLCCHCMNETACCCDCQLWQTLQQHKSAS